MAARDRVYTLRHHYGEGDDMTDHYGEGDDMTESGQTPPGWYHAQGDPAGSERYWNGDAWQGEPRPAQTHQLATPNLASGGARIGAALIDVVIGIVLFFVFANTASSDGSFSVSLGTGGVAALFLWGIVSSVVMVALLGGGPGKLALGLRIIRADDHVTPPGWPTALKRWAITLVQLIPLLGGLVQLVLSILSLVWIFSDDEKRSIYDRIGGTRVIKT
ncbi:MAG: putative RDD family membrane protein YckC [Candidatus Poriferisodalaceae bacterium]|jgi:uncharacterized RDD family membrane protein YckC